MPTNDPKPMFNKMLNPTVGLSMNLLIVVTYHCQFVVEIITYNILYQRCM